MGVISCAEWVEIVAECFLISDGLAGVVYGECMVGDFELGVEDLMNLGHGSADAGGDLRKAEAGPAYGRWVGCALWAGSSILMNATAIFSSLKVFRKL